MVLFLRGTALAAVLLAVVAVPAVALELLMVERPRCPYCKRWDIEIAPHYGKTEEGRLAPLRRAGIGELPGDVAFEAPVTVSPTFVLIDNGKEIGRVTGYTNDLAFWGLLKELVNR